MAPPHMTDRLLTQEDLLAASGFERAGDLARSLREQGIHYFTGKGGRIWTTIDLVNMAGGLRPHGTAVEPYSVEDFR